MKEIHGNMSNPFFQKIICGQKHNREVNKQNNSIPYVLHTYILTSMINTQPYMIAGIHVQHW